MMITTFANPYGSLIGAGLDASAAPNPAAIVIRALGAFCGGLAVTALLAGLFGH